MAVKRKTQRVAATKTARPKPRRAAPARTARAAQPAATASSGGERTEYRIYPSIGIARVGDSKDGFIIGPEAPGEVPEGPFRGKDDGIKPQGARFRIFQVDIDANENETVRREVTGGRDVQVEWTVQLANRKAGARQIYSGRSGTLTRNTKAPFRNVGFDRDKLVIASAAAIKNAPDAAPVRMSGAITFAKGKTVQHRVDDIELATLRSDAVGRLIVVGGPGTAKSPANTPLDSFSDNDGWYDSVSDGPVSATLRIGKTLHPVIPAWVVITVPRYAPGVYGIVTWFDQALNMARTDVDGRFDPPRTTSFLHDVYPILKRTDGLAAVHFTKHGHGPRALTSAERLEKFQGDSELRKGLLERLTRPNAEAKGFEQVPEFLMPALNSGANPDLKGPKFAFLSLTPYQFAHLQHWVRGDFVNDWPGAEPKPMAFEKIPVARQPHALNEAALEACVGGPFFPGIEATYDMARITTYRTESHLRHEFRIDPSLPAGSLTEKMALPWQADFADCGESWWPSQRPVSVTTEGGASDEWSRGIDNPNEATRHRNMVAFWSCLAFIVRDDATGTFREQDRLAINGVV
ncbi:MAG: LodA/GoxA family CTQ-dependent oxidase [Vicinamibacterales bacterium]